MGYEIDVRDSRHPPSIKYNGEPDRGNLHSAWRMRDRLTGALDAGPISLEMVFAHPSLHNARPMKGLLQKAGILILIRRKARIYKLTYCVYCAEYERSCSKITTQV